jgi:cytochrome c oxidase cbb3-type subunit 3/ubiquinol-cytochrome c reductase cytochrome c subunit
MRRAALGKIYPALGAICAGLLALSAMGCGRWPGKPGFRAETMRPDQVHDFATLYQENCSACHGDNGLKGAALPLNNPVYLQWAGHDRLVNIVANGVPHTLMPAFGRGGGGLLTNQQVEDIVNGMMTHWGKADALKDTTAPAYGSGPNGNIAQGQVAFGVYCARCHGADGKGVADSNSSAGAVHGSIVDATYLSLVSPQALRDVIVAGRPGDNMPDWRGDDAGKPMSDADVSNIVAWLESQRGAAFGRPVFIPPQQQEKQNEQIRGGKEKNRRQLPE